MKMTILLHVSTTLILLLFSSPLQLVMATDSGLVLENYYCNETRGYYAVGSTYAFNLIQAISNLTSESKFSGFHNTSSGFNPDQAYALYLCRGDVSSHICESCVTYASKMMLKYCPNQKEVILWFNFCMLRYSNWDFFSFPQLNPSVIHWSSLQNVPNVDQFNQLMPTTLDSLAKKTAFDPINRMFVTHSGNISSGSSTFYFLLQCTQDLWPSSCYSCLSIGINGLSDCCYGSETANFLMPSCSVQYSTTPFYYTANNSTKHGNSGTWSKKIRTIFIMAKILVLVATAALLLAMLTFCFQRLKRKVAWKQNFDGDDDSLQFDIRTIRAATDNFSTANTLGRGGFGIVYKGKLPNGQEIAVKRLSKNSSQGDKEFKNEVALVTKLQHRNLVRLLGFCLREKEKLLIYEFVPNASLDHFLFDPISDSDLNWETRYKIIVGITRGMLYLHQDSRLKIIHRDLKSSNILLDSDFCPKISDFGMARLFRMDQTHCSTSRIAGTRGYMAPEYILTGQFSSRSDVYAYGVLLLEIISGQRNCSAFEDLLSIAREHWTKKKPLELLDLTLRECYSRSEVIKCIHIGLLCAQDDPALRPSMASVMVMLESNSPTIPALSSSVFLANGRNGQRTREYFQNTFPSTSTPMNGYVTL